MSFRPSDLRELVLRCGLLPLFPSAVPGFSVEEMFPDALWWTDTEEDPWNARIALSDDPDIVYAKMFAGKAGFASREAYALLLSLRRDGYDFDTLCDMGMAPLRERRLMEAVFRVGEPVTGRQLKALAGFGKEGLRGFEPTVEALQQRCYLLIWGHTRSRNRFGEEYGWNQNLYTAPELRFGQDWVHRAYETGPEEALARLQEQVTAALPGLDSAGVRRLIEGGGSPGG